MKLKRAIQRIETSYTVFIILALSAAGSFLLFSGTERVIAILSLLILSGIIFLIRIQLVNSALKRCIYPYEFLSVLKQMNLLKGMEINPGDDLINGQDFSDAYTQQFLADNRLPTGIRLRKPDTIRTSGKQYSYEPVIQFTEKGLLLRDRLYAWTSIRQWKVTGERKHTTFPYYSLGSMQITYEKDNQSQTVAVNLNNVLIDKIDFLLLLTHFKAKYSRERQELVN